MKAIMRSMKDSVYQFSEIEKKVREATNNEKWGVPGTVMAEIARATNDYTEYPKLFSMLWKRLNDEEHMLHVKKALILLEYLLRNGSERFITNCKEKIRDIARLKKYKHYDANNEDDAGDARIKAAYIYDLLTDDEKLREEREKAERVRNSGKIAGLSHDGSTTVVDSVGGTSRGKSRPAHDDWAQPSRRQAMRGDDDEDPFGDGPSARADGGGGGEKTKKKKKKKNAVEERGDDSGNDDIAGASGGEEVYPKKKPAKEDKKKKKKKDVVGEEAGGEDESAGSASAIYASHAFGGEPVAPVATKTKTKTKASKAAPRAPSGFEDIPAPFSKPSSSAAEGKRGSDVFGGDNLKAESKFEDLFAISPIPMGPGGGGGGVGKPVGEDHDSAPLLRAIRGEGKRQEASPPPPPPQQQQQQAQKQQQQQQPPRNEESKKKDSVWDLTANFANLDNIKSDVSPARPETSTRQLAPSMSLMRERGVSQVPPPAAATDPFGGANPFDVGNPFIAAAKGPAPATNPNDPFSVAFSNPQTQQQQQRPASGSAGFGGILGAPQPGLGGILGSQTMLGAQQPVLGMGMGMGTGMGYNPFFGGGAQQQQQQQANPFFATSTSQKASASTFDPFAAVQQNTGSGMGFLDMNTGAPRPAAQAQQQSNMAAFLPVAGQSSAGANSPKKSQGKSANPFAGLGGW
jgi:hypothetical protein